MAVSALYRGSKPCRRCSTEIPLSGLRAADTARLYCDPCRAVRRAITFLNQAAEALGPHRDRIQVDGAYHQITAAREGLGG